MEIDSERVTLVACYIRVCAHNSISRIFCFGPKNGVPMYIITHVSKCHIEPSWAGFRKLKQNGLKLN